MDVVVAVLLIGVAIGMTVALVSALVSAVRVEPKAWRAAQRGKGSTILLILITGGIGGTYYWLRIRPELRAPHPLPATASGQSPTAAELRTVAARTALGR